jgi:alcohol dehydrogenase class IV
MVCAALLPHVMKVNLLALKARDPESPALNRLTEFARMTGGSTAEEGINWIAGLCRDLQAPSLAALGVAEKDFPALVGNAQRASSMKTNPVELTADELEQILRAAL